MPQLKSPKVAVVTGATGYIASNLVQRLLLEGCTVRASVRSVSSPKNDFLMEFDGASDRLKLFEADLLEDESFDECIAGAQVCFHVASPYTLDVEDAQRDLVDPAVKGTLNVLKSCHKNKIRRVVLTSSVAAITDAPKAGYTFTEKDFNELSTLARNPYFFSKICAELAAWDFVKDKPEMKLVSINPSGVIGPSLNKDLNATPKFLLEFLSGKFPFLFEAYIPMVHIDDVVEAHIKGGSLPESKFQGTGPHRFLCTQVPAPSYERILQILKEKYPKGTFPSSYQVPSWIPYALSYFYGAGTGSFLRTNISKGEMLLSNDVIKKEFRMEFQSVEKAICDTVDDFIKWGHLPA